MTEYPERQRFLAAVFRDSFENHPEDLATWMISVGLNIDDFISWLDRTYPRDDR